MTPTHDHYDVVIVGGRIAGAATALLLARQGWRVLVLERTRRGTDTRSTHALLGSGVALLSHWGLRQRVVDAGTPPIRTTTFHYGDESVTIPLKPSDEVPALLAPRRTVLDPLLADAAVEAGAEVRFSTFVDEVRRDGEGRVVGVAGRTEAGRPFAVRAYLVVGADGVRSLVGGAVDAPMLVRGRHTASVVYAYFGPGDPDAPALDGYEWSYHPGAGAGLIPTNGGALAWIGVPPGRYEQQVRSDVEAQFWRVLHEAGPEVARRIDGYRRTSRFHTYPGTPGFLRQCHGHGWALVGDASHFTDPLSAHGMTDALRDAQLLADAVDAGLRDPAVMGRALAAYGHVRDRLSLPLMQVADRIASFRWDLAEVRVLLLELAASMKAELAVVDAARRPSLDAA